MFLFKVRDPGDTLRDISESVMRTVVGDRTVDEVITVGRQEIESEALSQLQLLVDMYELGLSIDQVQLKNVNPPRPVQASFDEVNQAEQEKSQLISEAQSEYNKVIPRARGEAEQTILQAVQCHVGRRGRDNPALRGSHLCRMESPSFHEPGVEPCPQFSLVSGDVFDQPIMREVIKTAPNIPFQNPVRFTLAG